MTVIRFDHCLCSRFVFDICAASRFCNVLSLRIDLYHESRFGAGSAIQPDFCESSKTFADIKTLSIHSASLFDVICVFFLGNLSISSVYFVM